MELGFEVADLGSRFVALLVDLTILAVALTAIGLAGLWVALELDLSAWLSSAGVAALLLVLFIVLWGYFVYFEAFHGGRTPGKRWSGLRVIHDGSQPLTVRGAAIRNLLRVIDAQPAFTWLVGGVAMWISPRTQRLGDLAAGTIVIRDRGDAEISPAQLAALARNRAGDPRLTTAEFDALERFVERRRELEPAARTRIAAQLGESLATHLASSGSREVELETRLAELYEDERPRRALTRIIGATASPLARTLVLRQVDQWSEFRALVDRADRKGLEALSAEEIERFAVLYRTTAADLARARTYGASGPLVLSLERWVGAGHNLLYRPGGRSWQALVRWLATGFPTLVRARWKYVAAAAVFLFVPALITYAAVLAEPTLARDLMPHEMMVRAETAAQRAEAGGGYIEVPEVFMPVLASQIITNNVQVTFFAFAGGILAGVGTALLLMFNGVHLGAAVGLFENEGAAALLWEFVAPHGVIELAAICIAGAAGLILGSALVAPGRLRRLDALAAKAKEAVSLLVGTTVLLILAGLIEGFISPAPLPITFKLGIAGAVAVAVAAYLLLAGAGETPPSAEAAVPAEHDLTADLDT